MGKYANSRSFRVALEERLKRRASNSGVSLDRLRKEAAHQRLLARLADVAPAESWALKGGLALIARLGDDTRATKDADATWRQSIDNLPDIINAVTDCDLADYFEFEIGSPKAIAAEEPEGGQRYPVVARLDGREYERHADAVADTVVSGKSAEGLLLSGPGTAPASGNAAVQLSPLSIHIPYCPTWKDFGRLCREWWPPFSGRCTHPPRKRTSQWHFTIELVFSQLIRSSSNNSILKELCNRRSHNRFLKPALQSLQILTTLHSAPYFRGYNLATPL